MERKEDLLLEVEENILTVVESFGDAEHDHAFKEGEWYFRTETEDLEGPFASKQECMYQFTEYCRRFL